MTKAADLLVACIALVGSLGFNGYQYWNSIESDRKINNLRSKIVEVESNEDDSGIVNRIGRDGAVMIDAELLRRSVEYRRIEGENTELKKKLSASLEAIGKSSELVRKLELVRNNSSDNGRRVENSYIVLDFENINGRDWKFFVPASTYIGYKSRSHRNFGGDLRDFVTWRDPSIVKIAREITRTRGARENGAQAILDLVLQNYYDQKSEYSDADYIRYPLETLVERNGDCEDSGILCAALMKAAGFEVALLDLDLNEGGHIAVGVVGRYNGTSYEFEGKKYYYAETSGRDRKNEGGHWHIGQMPQEFNNASARILPIR